MDDTQCAQCAQCAHCIMHTRADFDIARTLPRIGEKLLEKRTHADGCTDVDAKRLFV